MTFFHSIRASGIDPVIVDGGDFLFAQRDYKSNPLQRKQLLEKAKVIIDGYNRFGYTAAAVAECDLMLGVDALKELEKSMKFQLLCANFVEKESGRRYFEPSLVVVRNGVRIGIVAVVLDTFQQSFLDKIAPNAKVLPPLDALREEIARLRDEVDVFFLLAHIDRSEVDRLADRLEGVDFVLEPNSWSGNDTIWVSEEDHFVARNGRVLLKVDGQGAHIGRLDVRFGKRGLPWLPQDATPAAGEPANLWRGEDVELAPHIGKNAAIEAMIEQFRKNTRFVASTEPAEFTPSQSYLTVETCQACHPDQYAFWKESSHSRAFATLEKTQDEYRYDCISCHVLGYGETFIDAAKPGKFKDVQCESCHGTNPEHPSAPEKHQWPKVDDKACWGCHNPKVTREAFDPAVSIPVIQCPPLRR